MAITHFDFGPQRPSGGRTSVRDGGGRSAGSKRPPRPSGRNLTMRQRSSGRPEPIGRSSLRSKASSSNSGSDPSKHQAVDRVKQLKNCCRIAVEFMFTQVGVGALVVAYTIMGASIFQVKFHLNYVIYAKF